MPTPDDPLLGDHEVLGVLGRGGFGEVLLARHRHLGRLVALKRLLPTALTDPDATARLRREAQVLAGLDHSGIVALYDLRTGPTGAVLVMEYVAGRSLRDVLDQGPVAVPLALGVLGDVAAALAAAADAGVVHRDVKPANVLVQPGGRAKLGDFGIARAADPRLFRTADGMLTGTPAYLPPEVLDPAYEPDRHGDDYSFAVMAYEVLVGELPFRGDGLVLLGQHAHRPPGDPRQQREGFPADAATALLEGLAKDPARRLSAMALVDRLRAVPTAAWAAPPVPATASDGTVLEPRPVARVVPTPLPRARRRRTGWSRVAVAVGLGAVAVAAALAWSARDQPVRAEAVIVTVAPTAGACPAAEFALEATVTTNGGAGELRLRWDRPDGEHTDVVLPVAEGQREARARFTFRVTGGTPLRGPVTASVLGADHVRSEPVVVDYRCP